MLYLVWCGSNSSLAYLNGECQQNGKEFIIDTVLGRHHKWVLAGWVNSDVASDVVNSGEPPLPAGMIQSLVTGLILVVVAPSAAVP